MLTRLGAACVMSAATLVVTACLGGPAPPTLMPTAASSPAAWPPAASPSPAALPAALQAGDGRVRVVGAVAEGVNLRADPSPAGARLKGLFDGVELELIGPDRAADGRVRRHVRDPADRSEGWVAGEFLAPATGAASPTPTG